MRETWKEQTQRCARLLVEYTDVHARNGQAADPIAFVAIRLDCSRETAMQLIRAVTGRDIGR